jgi:hypothetical protein
VLLATTYLAGEIALSASKKSFQVHQQIKHWQVVASQQFIG